MKRIGRAVAAVSVLLMLSAASAFAEGGIAMNGELGYSETALSYSTAPALDLNAIGASGVAAEVVVGSTALTSATFNDGRASTFTLTVVSTQGVRGNYGSNTLTVTSNVSTSAVTAILKIGDYQYRQGIEWHADIKSSNTAINFMNAVNNSSVTTRVTASTPTPTTVLITCTEIGTYCNKSVSSNFASSMTWTSSAFTGGVDPLIVSVGGTTLTAGTTDQGAYLLVGATPGATALSLAAKLNTLLTGVMVSTAPAGSAVVYGTTSANGSSVALYTSRQDDLTIAPYTSSSTAASGTSYGAETSSYTVGSTGIRIPSHGFRTGNGVYFSTGSGVGISGLTPQTTYYIGRIDADHVALSTTRALSISGTYVTLASSAAASTTKHTFTLNAPALAGTPSYKWQSSIDGTFWNSVVLNSTGTAVSSVTVSGYTYGGAANFFDFGTPNYRYLRPNIVSPTAGAMWIKVYYNVKRAFR